MSRILLVWELGNNLGHVARFLPLAQELRKRGHEPILVLRDLSHVSSLALSAGLPLLQAPIWQGAVPSGSPATYADILLHYGYAEPDCLSSMVNSWRNLFTLTKPQMVIFDHAPTALLASRGLSMARALIGTGFCSPPRVSPFPTMRSWLPAPAQQLEANEARILTAVNTALKRHGVASLSRLADIFEVDEDFLCTYQELDHYQVRGDNSRYWGAGYSFGEGHEPVWSGAAGKNVFAYLDKNFGDLERLLQTLSVLPAQKQIYAPGIASQLITRYQSANMIFLTSIINFDALKGQCDLTICHAGHGTASAQLLMGIPMLLLPLHLEQYMNAINIEKMGAGICINPEQQKKNYATALNRLLNEKTFPDNAKNFALRYAHQSQQERVIKMADRCEELISHHILPT